MMMIGSETMTESAWSKEAKSDLPGVCWIED